MSSKALSLLDVEHGYYIMAPIPLSNHISGLVTLLPHLTTITLVTTDSSLALLTLFNNLSRVTLKLENYLGEGFIDLLTNLGDKLKELNASCSSDLEEDWLMSTLLLGMQISTSSFLTLLGRV